MTDKTGRETLHDELKRLIGEYEDDDAGESTKAEAWNLIADFTVENAKAVLGALSNSCNKCTSSDASASAGVKVKSLVWRQAGNYHRANSPSSGLEWEILDSTPAWEKPFQLIVRHLEAEKPEFFKTLAEAKAAAQADYEQRILSALSAVEAPQPQAGEAVALGLTFDARLEFQRIRDILADGDHREAFALAEEAIARCPPFLGAAPVPPQAVPAEVAGLIERLEDWPSYLPMREFCKEAIPDIEEAAATLTRISANARAAIDAGEEMIGTLRAEKQSTERELEEARKALEDADFPRAYAAVRRDRKP